MRDLRAARVTGQPARRDPEPSSAPGAAHLHHRGVPAVHWPQVSLQRRGAVPDCSHRSPLAASVLVRPAVPVVTLFSVCSMSSLHSNVERPPTVGRTPPQRHPLDVSRETSRVIATARGRRPALTDQRAGRSARISRSSHVFQLESRLRRLGLTVGSRTPQMRWILRKPRTWSKHGAGRGTWMVSPQASSALPR
jgi:hypothetical protein